MNLKIKLLLAGILLIAATTSAYLYWQNTIPLISPVALVEAITGHSTALRSSKIVYGFFPYWNTKYADQLSIEHLTHFAYFAVDLNPDGTINKANSKKELEPGWNKLNSPATEKLLYQSKILNQNTVVTVTAMDPELIDSILNHPDHSRTAIESILDVYAQKKFDSINVDFEYVGEPSIETRNNFTTFIKNLKTKCLSLNPKCQIDIDVFADSGDKYRIWDLKSLSQSIDHLVVMAYDYYRKSSTKAGPVAPLTGKCSQTSATKCLDEDIMTHLSQITKLVPSEKILLGIPFYGYEWQTSDRDFLSNTYPRTGSLATYSRIQSLLSDSSVASLSSLWSEKTLSPYLVFEIDKEIHQIQYENSESLKQKIMIVKSANLGGIAIWALGYEVPFQDIWDPIKNLSTL